MSRRATSRPRTVGDAAGAISVVPITEQMSSTGTIGGTAAVAAGAEASGKASACQCDGDEDSETFTADQGDAGSVRGRQAKDRSRKSYLTAPAEWRARDGRGWGDGDSSNDERLAAEVPPHWDQRR